ncbi:hypothetical protein AVDCRST_MAG92-4305 [uncultured Coleofasciculus sp.]|uniref:HNH domain-containing protein n=1 Tax=uncultured Coleofasciculus sp. TaxID=1267456 RepID=A0A6J4JZG7_9CYAN|nr:hypothetical protein AVDCRST_MAG92-4305 [uncultured Coleofasciculus sp.]
MVHLPKTQPGPPCLEVEKAKANGTYHCEGVLPLIQKDFKNKCYLCEDKAPLSINIEHFKPHRGDKELKFDWNNLYYACSHCNNTKSDKYEYLLDCTREADGVDRRIKYKINPFPKEKAVITALEDSQAVNDTVALLRAIYNGTTELKLIESANLRSKLLKEIRRFQDLLFDYYDNEFDDEEKQIIKDKIVRELRSASCFTAFKRWIIRERADFFADFNQLLG